MKTFWKKVYDIMLNGPTLKKKAPEEEKTVIDYTDTAKVEEGKAIYRRIEEYRKSVPEDEIDHVKVFERRKKAALLGCTDAQLMLHYDYSFGTGTPKDYKESKRWLLEAANRGHARSQCLVGTGCQIGIFGMQRNRQEAYRWYSLAARQDYADAWWELSEMHSDYKYPEERDEQKAFEYCKKAAELGSSHAMKKLGRRYEYGYGTDIDIARAVECYRQAAEWNNTSAMRALAYMYKKGDHLEQNLEEAFRLYKLAADKDDIEAKYELAEMYRRGEGTEKDIFAARNLYGEISPKHEKARIFMAKIVFMIDEAIKADSAERMPEFESNIVVLTAGRGETKIKLELGYSEYRRRLAEAFDKYEQQEKEKDA